MSNKLDLSAFDEEEAAPAAELDLSAFDDTAPAVKAASPEASELSPGEAQKTLGGTILGQLAGTAISPTIEKGVEYATSKTLDPAKRNLAFKAIGGESTPAGKKFLKDQAQDFSHSSLFSSQDIGQKVLDNKLLGRLGLASSGDMYEKAGDISKKSSEDLNNFIDMVSSSSEPVPLKDHYGKFQEAVLPKLSRLEDEDLINQITGPDAQKYMDNEANLKELEIAKRRTVPKGSDYHRQNDILKQKRRMYKEASEELLGNIDTKQGTSGLGGLLDKFKELKKSVGEDQTIQKLLMDKSVRDAVSGDVDLNVKDILAAGVVGPTKAAALKVAERKGAGVLAKGLDFTSDVLKKGSKIIAPGMGALLGGTVGAMAADDNTGASDFIPGLDQAGPAGNAMDDRMIKKEAKALNNYENSSAGGGRKLSPEFLQKLIQTPTTYIEAPEEADTNERSNNARAAMEQNMNAANMFSNNANQMEQDLNKAEDKARKNYESSPAAMDSDNTPAMRLKKIQEMNNAPKVQQLQDQTNRMQLDLAKADDSFKNGFAYKQAQSSIAQNKAQIERLSNKTSPVVEDGKALSKSSPDQLMEILQSFTNVKGADKFVAPLENAAQASSDEERKARLFGLYQQPAFRQLLRKGNNSEE